MSRKTITSTATGVTSLTTVGNAATVAPNHTDQLRSGYRSLGGSGDV